MTLTVPLHSSVQGTPHDDDTANWTIYTTGRTFECKVVVVREVGGFSVHAADLPGVVSQGDTVDDAVRNITEAFKGALVEYLANGAIPWAEVTIDEEVECRKWILVDV